jgi:hypothetical protein
LGDKLAYGWVGVNELPYNNIDFAKNAPVIEQVSYMHV